ncbi:MAG: DUF4286 family protein [Flavobacteriales bacterium]
MILYNVTVNIDPTVHEEWLEWMKDEHIPAVMQTGCFLSNNIFRLLTTQEGEGFTYSFQYTCESMDHLQRYIDQFAPALQKEHSERYKDKFVAFRSLLEKI